MLDRREPVERVGLAQVDAGCAVGGGTGDGDRVRRRRRPRDAGDGIERRQLPLVGAVDVRDDDGDRRPPVRERDPVAERLERVEVHVREPRRCTCRDVDDEQCLAVELVRDVRAVGSPRDRARQRRLRLRRDELARAAAVGVREPELANAARERDPVRVGRDRAARSERQRLQRAARRVREDVLVHPDGVIRRDREQRSFRGRRGRCGERRGDEKDPANRAHRRPR